LLGDQCGEVPRLRRSADPVWCAAKRAAVLVLLEAESGGAAAAAAALLIADGHPVTTS